MRTEQEIKKQIEKLHDAQHKAQQAGALPDQIFGELTALYWALGHDHREAMDLAAGEAHDWTP